MTTNQIIQILAGFVGSMGFAVLFNVRGIKLFIASIGNPSENNFIVSSLLYLSSKINLCQILDTFFLFII